MTRPGFFVAYYGQTLNKWTDEANNFFVAYHSQAHNKLMSTPTMIIMITHHVIY